MAGAVDERSHESRHAFASADVLAGLGPSRRHAKGDVVGVGQRIGLDHLLGPVPSGVDQAFVDLKRTEPLVCPGLIDRDDEAALMVGRCLHGFDEHRPTSERQCTKHSQGSDALRYS